MDLERRDPLVAHDHAVAVYDRPTDLNRILKSFLGEAAKRRDLVAFVHAYPSEAAAWGAIRAAAPASWSEEAEARVRIADSATAFEGGAGKIDHAHVERVVAGLVEESAKTASGGLSIFVDASWRYLESGRGEEWFAFEEWLGQQLAAAAVLVCAYRKATLNAPRMLTRVRETHAWRYG